MNHRGVGGKRPDLNNVYFRSRWEANTARLFNFFIRAGQIQWWKFEPETFYFAGIKRGTISYTPDFKVCKNDGTIEYYEVKGHHYPKGETAIKRFAKYYPQHRLTVLDAEYFKAIKKQGMDELIPGWE